VVKLNREQESAKQYLFPMYPTGQLYFSAPLEIPLDPNRSFFGFPACREYHSLDWRRRVRWPVPPPHFHYERERWVGPVQRRQQFLAYRHSSGFDLRSYSYSSLRPMDGFRRWDGPDVAEAKPGEPVDGWFSMSFRFGCRPISVL